MEKHSTEKLSKDQIHTFLDSHPGWKIVNDALTRSWEFETFVEAFAFLTQVALISERQDHHPEIWNCYNKVTLSVFSHDAGGITQRDVRWCRSIGSIRFA